MLADELTLLSVLLMGFVTGAITVSRGGVVAGGVCLGTAILTRAAVLPILPVAIGVLAWQRRYRDAALVACATAIVVAPWAARNISVSGTAWPVRSGENFFHGNSRYASALIPTYNLDLLGEYGEDLVRRERPDLLATFPGDETWFDLSKGQELDRFFTTKAWDDIRERPAATLWLKVRNVAYFFWPRAVPYQVTQPDTRIELRPDGNVVVENTQSRPLLQELAYAASYSVVAGAALVGAWIRRRELRADALLWVLLGAFAITAVVYYPATRHRVPVEFVLLFYAAVGFERLLPRPSPASVPVSQA